MTRWRRGAAAVLAAGGALLVLATGAAAHADTSPTPSGSAAPGSGLPLAVTLTRLSPYAPQPGGTLTLAATLHDVSPQRLVNLDVRLLVSPSKVGSRGEFDSYAGTPDGPPPVDATAVAAHVDLPTASLPADGAETVTVTVPVDTLTASLPQTWQVYELALVVDAQPVVAGAVGATTTVGRLRTFLPWAPVDTPGAGYPTRVAWLWPLVDRPHRVTGSTWTDGALAGELGSGGRLRRLLAAGTAAENQHAAAPRPPRRGGKHRQSAPPPPQPPVNPVPVTWAVDPMLVGDATAMSTGYTVGTGSDAHRGRGQAAARSFLSALRAATGSGEVLSLPYGDPDVTAATRAGLGPEVQVASTAGQALLAHSQAVPGTPLNYGWPPGGFTDQRTLQTFFGAGVTTVVLDSQALPVVGGTPSETPGAHAQIQSRDGTVDALLVDHGLSSVVDQGAASPAAGPLAVQRLLSELLMIQAEQPFDSRWLVLAPKRRWQPTTSYADALLAGTGKVPWVEPVPLSQVASSPVYTKVSRPRLDFPDAARHDLLDKSYLHAVHDLKRQIDIFASILLDGDPLARTFDTGVLRLLSSSWRGDQTGAYAAEATLAKQVSDTMGLVRITSGRDENGAPNPSRSLVTLTSHSGTVPVTVSNELDSPVRIVIGMSGSGGRLVVKGGRVAKTIPAHHKAPVDVHATAQASGVFPLTVTLYTRNGDRYGQPVELLVRSTAYGVTALIITGGATGVLLLAVGVRLVRRARAARRRGGVAA